MEITVKYYPSNPGSGCELNVRKFVVRDAATIQDLLKDLGLSSAEATAIFRNGESALYQQVLHQGDVVTIMPFVSGG